MGGGGGAYSVFSFVSCFLKNASLCNEYQSGE